MGSSAPRPHGRRAGAGGLDHRPAHALLLGPARPRLRGRQGLRPRGATPPSAARCSSAASTCRRRSSRPGSRRWPTATRTSTARSRPRREALRAHERPRRDRRRRRPRRSRRAARRPPARCASVPIARRAPLRAGGRVRGLCAALRHPARVRGAGRRPAAAWPEMPCTRSGLPAWRRPGTWRPCAELSRPDLALGPGPAGPRAEPRASGTRGSAPRGGLSAPPSARAIGSGRLWCRRAPIVPLSHQLALAFVRPESVLTRGRPTQVRKKSRYTEGRDIAGAFEGETMTRRRLMAAAPLAAGGIAIAAFALPALGFALGPVFEDTTPDELAGRRARGGLQRPRPTCRA